MQCEVRPVQDVAWLVLQPKPSMTTSGLIHIPPEKRETRIYDDPVKKGKMRVLEPEYRYSEFGTCLVGTVVAIGPGKHNGRKFIPTELRPGDKVLVPPNRGVERNYKGKDYLIMREKDVQLKLEGE